MNNNAEKNTIGEKERLEKSNVTSEVKENHFITKGEQFKILINGIAEGSKNARSILFSLVVISIYSLITVLPIEAESGKEIILPIINRPIDLKTFFFIAPLIIFANYVYLCIYLQELSKRIDEYKKLNKDHQLLFDPHFYLYPWLFVFSSFEFRSVNGGFKYFIYSIQKYITLFILWWLAPVVQLAFWISFVSRQDMVSLIPFFCMVFSVIIVLINIERELNKGAKWFLIIFVSLLFIANLSSLKTFQKWVFVDSIWSVFQNILKMIEKVELSLIPIFIAIITIIIPIIVSAVRQFKKLVVEHDRMRP